MPSLQQEGCLVRDQSFDPSKLHPVETAAPFQADRFEPELGGRAFAFHVYVRRFVPVRRVEQEPIRPEPKNRWQRISVYPIAGRVARVRDRSATDRDLSSLPRGLTQLAHVRGARLYRLD